MPKGKKKKRLNVDFQKVAVIAVLAQVFLYTWFHLIFSYIRGTEIAPTVSMGFYGFCGFEAGILGVLKSQKRKKGESNNEGTDHSETDES